MDFQSEKSFGKLRLRAFQLYYQILCMSKHVEDYLRHLRHALIYTASVPQYLGVREGLGPPRPHTSM